MASAGVSVESRRAERHGRLLRPSRVLAASLVLLVCASATAAGRGPARTAAAGPLVQRPATTGGVPTAVILQPGSGYYNPRISAAVRTLQRRLALLGFQPGRPDGRYGDRTERAVKRFQAAHGLTVDGTAGPRTLTALAAAISHLTPASSSPTPSTARSTTPSLARPAHRRTTAATAKPRPGSLWGALPVLLCGVLGLGLLIDAAGRSGYRRSGRPAAAWAAVLRLVVTTLRQRRRPALTAAATVAAAALAALAIASGLALYLLYIGVSLLLGAIGATTLVWMLHAWRTPSGLAASRLGTDQLAPAHSFSLIVPARHEEPVLDVTLSRLVQADHPSFEVLVVVGDDDPATRAVAERMAELHPERIRVVVDASSPKSKPKALNAALPDCVGTVTGVFDAEDDVHPALLRRVDQCFQKTDADVVQAGVQLMNFRSSWLTVRNVLEYYFWFRSRLHLHARQRFIPLGGNTVFVRTAVLRAVGGWDPECLAEDCELGVRLSAFGAHTAVFYEPELVTREECPPTLAAFIRQRTRWNQGYLQTLARGYWQQLPLRQRALGLYILAMPYVLALAWLMFPIALVTAIAVSAPIGITLFSFLPMLPMFSILAMEVAGLGEFCRAYDEHASARDYARLVFGLPLYQFILAFSAARAVARELRGAKGWEKTEHLGLHLAGKIPATRGSPPQQVRPRRGAPADESVAPSHARAPARAPALIPSVALASSTGASSAAGLLGGIDGRPIWARLHSVSPLGTDSPSTPVLPTVAFADELLERLRRLATRLRGLLVSHVDVTVQVALLTALGIVQGTNMLHWPATLFDEGTYVGNAWAVTNRGTLAFYTYTYGHPPLAWLLISVWTVIHGLFGDGRYSLDTGRELMFVVNMVGCSLLYVLARRLKLRPPFAAGVVLLFVLSPVALFFHRGVLLDNPATTWAIAAFLLARSPRRNLWSFAGSGACFAVSGLSKETTLVLLPALLLAAVENTVPSTRRYCLTLMAAFFCLIGFFFPLYATLKGELLPGPGHVSLLGTDINMLFTRQGTGSVFDPHAVAHGTVMFWLRLDPWLLGVALALSPIGLALRDLRAVTAAFLIQVVMIVRPGYLPAMYVIALLPFAALIVGGCAQAMWRTASHPRAQSPPLVDGTRWQMTTSRLAARLRPAAAIASAVGLGVMAVVAVHVAPRWAAADRAAMHLRLDTPEREAEQWLLRHVNHQQRLIVTDDFWVFLIEHGFDSHRVKGGFNSRTVVSYWPLDKDPAVRRYFPRGWREFDYVVENSAMRDTATDTPNTEAALQHSHPVAVFGYGDSGIVIRKITP